MKPSVNTRRIMVARRHGWEGASPGLLAKVFDVSVQQATAITNERCAACNRAICGHSDAQWAGEPDHVGAPDPKTCSQAELEARGWA